MTRNDKARICLAVVTAAFAAVAISKVDIAVPSGVARWVVFCVVAGIVMNSQEGMSTLDTVLGSIAASMGFVGALLWLAFMTNWKLHISGAYIDRAANSNYFNEVMIGLFVVSIVGISIGTTARPATLNLLVEIGNIDLKAAKNIEAFLRLAASICGVGALFLL